MVGALPGLGGAVVPPVAPPLLALPELFAALVFPPVVPPLPVPPEPFVPPGEDTCPPVPEGPFVVVPPQDRMRLESNTPWIIDSCDLLITCPFRLPSVAVTRASLLRCVRGAKK